MSWTLIEHQALTSSVASVTLGSGGTIPQTYKTLKLVVSARTDRASVTDDMKIAFNNLSTNQSMRILQGNGAAASSATDTLLYGTINGNSATASTFGNLEVTIPNYASTTANKPTSHDGVGETNGTTAYQRIDAGLWSSTAAITSIVLTPYTGPNFVSGSTFTLYGLA